MSSDCNPEKLRMSSSYIMNSVYVFMVGLGLIVLGKFIIYFFSYVQRNKRSRLIEDDDDHVASNTTGFSSQWYLDFKEAIGSIVSGESLAGRIIVIVIFLFNLLACAIYITESAYPVEYCKDAINEILLNTELVIYGFFIVHFIIRFLAANDKLMFWFEILTLADIFTIPTVISAVTGGHNWIGLRFLRIIHIMNLADILNFLKVLPDGPSTEMAEMIGIFVTIWLGCAGAIHLVENTGDPWYPINYQNKRNINYFECLYFLLVTMSTVGYGDYYCKTYIGKFITMAFIGVGLGLFTSYIPSMLEFLRSHSKYTQSFHPEAGKKHVIVAGHVVEESVASFIREFLHPDRDDNATTVVFLCPEHPSVGIQSLLKCHDRRTLYFVGTIYSVTDCARMKMKEADAVIILCNKTSANPDDEDSKNITRVISIKNYHESMRCIVQLIMCKNKSHLMNCPQWNPNFGDEIVCINELKHGLIAQSCYAPGFSTLMGNLFTMRTADILEEIDESEQWKVAYITGAGHELYAAKFSSSFIGMTFKEAVELCFEKLQLMLIAVEFRVSKIEKYFAINPTDRKMKFVKNTRGFFLGQNAKEVSRATRYCSSCHKDLCDPQKMWKCRCRSRRLGNKNLTYFMGNMNQSESDAVVNVEVDPSKLLEAIPTESAKNKRKLTDDIYPSGDKPKFDATGTFFWCETRNYIQAKKSLEEARLIQFKQHVVVMVLCERNSASLELRQLVLPLRASNQIPSAMKKIVILGDEAYLHKEWSSLANFPDVIVVVGSPHNRADLRAVNVDTADMCIILTPGMEFESAEHSALSDKEVILVTLNLKAMNFDEGKLFVPNADAGNDALLPAINEKEKPSAARSSSFDAVSTASGGTDIVVPGPLPFLNDTKKLAVRTITELLYPSNAMYMDPDDKNVYEDEGIFLTSSYACGAAMTVSCLDSLVSATYFNADLLTLVRNMITGSVSNELDEMLAEGIHPHGSYETNEIAAVRNRCRIGQVSLYGGALAEFGECGLFGDLFLYALRTYDMICLGLYRYRDPDHMRSEKRYVITFPSFNFVLAPTDLVFVLMQFDSWKKKKRPGRRGTSIMGSSISSFMKNP